MAMEPQSSFNIAYVDSQETPRYEPRHLSSSFVMARQIVKRRRGRPRKDGGVCKQRLDKSWTPDETRALIDEWRVKDVLYNQKHKHYHDKETRQEALHKIAIHLRDKGIDATEQQIFEKLISLRSYYCSQLSKIEMAKATGDSYYESNWRYFHDLNFLNSSVIPRKTEFTSPGRERSLTSPTSSAHTSPLYSGSLLVRKDSFPPLGYHVLQVPATPARLPRTNPRDLTNEETAHPSSCIFTVPARPPPPYMSAHGLPTMHHSNLSANAEKCPNAVSHDEMFGDLVAGMMSEIDESSTKDELKIKIQKLIVRRKYDSQNLASPKEQHDKRFEVRITSKSHIYAKFGQDRYSPPKHSLNQSYYGWANDPVTNAHSSKRRANDQPHSPRSQRRASLESEEFIPAVVHLPKQAGFQ